MAAVEPKLNLAKVVGELLKRPVDTVCNLIESLLGEPFKVGGAALADQIAYWQWTNRVSILERFERIRQERKLAVHILPPDFLLPFIRECGDTSDEQLQEAWARLLSAAVESDVNQHIGFVHVLRELSPTDAKVIQAIIKHCPGFTEESDVDRTKRVEELAAYLNLPAASVRLSINNLHRLGLLNVTGLKLSGFARSLLRVCLTTSDELDQYLERERNLKSARLRA